MDLLNLHRLRNLLIIIDELGLVDETASHSPPSDQTEQRGWKSHIPSVTTVPRETRAPSGDGQARPRPIAVPDEKEATPGSSPVMASAPTTEADAGQVHDTLNPVETPCPGNRSKPQQSRTGPQQYMSIYGSAFRTY